MKRLLAFAFVAFLATASNCGTGPKPTPTPTPDAAPPASCVTVCQRGAALGCSWANDTPNGASCATVCENALAFGFAWDLNCRSTGSSCAVINTCR